MLTGKLKGNISEVIIKKTRRIGKTLLETTATAVLQASVNNKIHNVQYNSAHSLDDILRSSSLTNAKFLLSRDDLEFQLG